MPSRFMFLFLTFFLIVTCCTFDSEVPIQTKVHEHSKVPLATISKITPQRQEAPPVVEVAPPTEFMTKIHFSKGKLSISERAKEEIRALFERAKREGKIRAAKIITWADQALPKKKSLSWDQLKLAEDRNDKVEALIENLDLQLNVAKISMAERPEIMDDLLSREDKEIRKSYEDHGTPYLSRSIVMFLLKDK